MKAIVGKGENAGSQYFLLFMRIITYDTIEWLSANHFNLDWSRIVLFGQELIGL